MCEIPINKALTDSFSFSIPIHQVEILDKRIISETSTAYLDIIDKNQKFHIDEIVSPPKPLKIEVNGIRTRFKVAYKPQRHGEPIKLLEITVPAKLLKQNYFIGINKDNLKDIYNELMSYELVHFTYDNFLNGFIRDIDIAVNYRMELYVFMAVIHQVVESVKISKKTYVQTPFFKKHKQGEFFNVGLELNKREKAHPIAPYFKFYAKELEINSSKNATFYNLYLFDKVKNKEIDLKDLQRTEFTIKNYTHKKHLIKKGLLKNECRTVKEYFEHTQDDLYNIHYQYVNEYIITNDRVDYSRIFGKLSPTDRVLIYFINTLISEDYSEKEILESIKDFPRVQKSRMKTKIKKLINLIENNIVHQKQKLKSNAKIYKAFNEILNRNIN